jgi:hypothetical protein
MDTCYFSLMAVDGCESSLTSAANVLRATASARPSDALIRDADGAPMLLLAIFDAETWEEAKAEHERHCDEHRQRGLV